MTRLLTLLLITQAAAEWVEISQQHYRKPIRTHSPITTPDRLLDVEVTTKSWTYNNRSVTEYNWNKNPARPPNIGNVKRKQHESNRKTIERNKEDEDDLDLHVDFRDYELRRNYERPTTELHEQKGSIERVPNVGNIKRVQLNSSPVKSPVVNYKGDREKYSNNQYENNPHNYDDDDDEENEFEHKKNTEAFRRIYVNKANNLHRAETTTFPPVDDKDTYKEATTEDPKRIHNNHTKVREFYTTKPTFITEDFTNYDSQRNRFYKITTDKILTTEIIDTDEVTTMSSKRSKPTAMKGNKNNINDLKAESHENKVHLTSNNEKSTNVMNNKQINNDNKTKLIGHTDELKQDIQSEKENLKDNVDKAPADNKTEKNKVNTMENVIKFMRVVADTISKNTRRSFGGKMQYLHELKQSILANIEERIDATWPDDDSTGARRRSRSAQASPRGHVQFPSSESALMTISFLTFAVFLIKLVLQVIQTYKQKAMMVAPLMVASGRNVFAHHGHH